MSDRAAIVDEATARLASSVPEAERDPLGVFQSIANEALAAFDADGAAVSIPIPHRGGARDFEIVAAAGAGADELAGLCFPVSQTATGEAFRSQKTVVLRDAQIAGRSLIAQRLAGSFNIRSLMAVPLMSGGMLGIFCSDADRFSDDDIVFAERFASLASAAHGLSQRAAMAERERLMAELHDGAIQVLYGALVESELGLEVESLAEAKESLGEVVRLVRDGLAELREAVLAADSPRLSLHERMRRSAHQFSKRAHLSLGFEGDDLAPDDYRTEDLFRIQLEAISNAIRHGRADRIDVTLANGDRGLILTIADDGVGFDPEIIEAGQGLVNMPRRADRIGATCEVASELCHGTTVVVTILPEVEEG